MATTPSVDAPEETDAAKVAAVAAAVLGAVLTLGALAFFGTRTGLSVAIGAIIAVANLVMMSAIVRAMLRPVDAEVDASADEKEKEDAEKVDPVDHAAEGKRGGAAWGVFGLLKIVVLFGGIYVLLTKGMVDPMPLVVGYGVLPLGIAASSAFTSLAPRRRRTVRRK